MSLIFGHLALLRNTSVNQSKLQSKQPLQRHPFSVKPPSVDCPVDPDRQFPSTLYSVYTSLYYTSLYYSSLYSPNSDLANQYTLASIIQKVGM